ncbi:MAG: pyruvate formate-lyase-activating protein [Candidatus Omnitrophota bacterium]|nr:pyruvate formate-lyase-activating protein [Candidatus Omnitrophota bacterium]
MRICKDAKITGNIHSFETFGVHEGPGIRSIVFFQGCIGRCLYCQNPDTWEEGAGRTVSVQEIVDKIDRCLPYIVSSGGGVTLSGGEPLLQIGFLRQLLSACKNKQIHTAIDTSAFYRLSDELKLSGLLPLVDLFILDVKAVDKNLHQRLTSKTLEQVLRFITLLEDNKKQYWIRYVLVPEVNDSEQDLKELGELVRSLHYCCNFEFLAYHTLGKHKWKHLGLDYPLKNKRPAVLRDIKRAKQLGVFN